MYDFKNLSPLDFEELVRDLLQAKMQVRLEGFRGGRDHGIDFRFAIGRESIVVQAKHYIRSGENALIATAKKENEKVKKLRPSRYILVTSLPMSATLKSRVIEAMPSASLAEIDIIGQEDLNSYLRDFPEVEKAHIKLWLSSTSVLEKVLNSSVYHRTETEIELIKKMIPRFVQNKSVAEAENILAKNGTLIISGDPGVGKTTLARMLVSLHIAQDWELHVVSDMEEAFRVSSRGSKKLIFFDDFLGQVRLSSDHVRGLDQRLPPFLYRVQSSSELRFILTTRELILNQAKILSGQMASKSLIDNKYILDVGKYTREVRGKILYNHLYFSLLSSAQLGSLLEGDFYIKMIDHKNFNPRLIDILTREDYQVIAGEPLKDAITRIMANPDELWARPFKEHISPDGRSLMFALLMSNPVVSIAGLKATFGRVSAALEPTFPIAQAQARFSSALKELEGAVLTIVNRRVSFSNPGVRDFLQVAIVADDLLLPLIEQLETFEEIKQAWTIYDAQRPRWEASESRGQLWLAALERLLDGWSESPLDRLGLILEIFDVFYEFEFMVCPVSIGIDALRRSQLDYNDVATLKHMLENVSMHLLPMDVQDDLHDVVTLLGCQFLSNGDAYSLNDIKEIEESLRSYGNDSSAVNEAVRQALDAFLGGLDEELYNISTFDELVWLQEDFQELKDKVSYAKPLPVNKIKSRSEYLLSEEENKSDSASYESAMGRSSLSRDISDEALRSMFSSIPRTPSE